MMTSKVTTGMAAATTIAAVTTAQTDAVALENAFHALKTYDWGADPETLKPIDRAIVATQGDVAARRALERMLADALAGGLSRSAQDYVCRRLKIVGTAQSVAALAALLSDETTSHIARYALERIPDDAAAAALRDALPKVGTKLKPGMIGSLGVRRDQQSVKAIAEALGDSDIAVARAAAQSLGLIGTPAAAKELRAFAKNASADMKLPTADARLVCAEQLLADGKRSEALALYRELNSDDQPTHVKIAAMKGMLAAATK